MANYINAEVSKTNAGKIRIQIDKEDFIKYLEKSEQDHRGERITERESLYGLMDE